MRELKIGVLVIGSLIWDERKHRQSWRTQRLDTNAATLVTVPIRYGRQSRDRKNTFTMVFSNELLPNRTGHGLVVPCRRPVTSGEELIEEAQELWVAEQTSSSAAGPISSSWGGVGLLPNPQYDNLDALVGEWRTRTNLERQNYEAFEHAAHETAAIDPNGILRIPWPSTLDGAPLSDIHLLLATATRPTLTNGRYPTVEEVSRAWSSAPNEQKYFDLNRKASITTADDARILELLVANRRAATTDAHQKSIEAVHRGFLYQHLYGVGCILLARTHAANQEVASERDEDIEIGLARERRYIQLKYRGSALQLSEVSSVLDRFAILRDEHRAGQREGEPRFFVVCNQEPANSLRNDRRVADLRVVLISPSAPPPADWGMPPALATVDDALEWCREQAALVPQTRLEASTLVWKLATEVALASAGRRPDGHVFVTSALDELFELLFVRNQHLPKAPSPYRPFDTEPDLNDASRATLVVALSGAGKTGWLAERALHLAGPIVYFDVGDNSDATVAPALVREIGGVLSESGAADELKRELYAGASGLASLRAIDAVLQRSGSTVTIALDNVHRIGPTRLSEVVSSVSSARWILLSQPSSNTPELRARLDCPEQTLGGLTTDAIAGIFRDLGSPATVTQAQRLRGITGGLPLFVKDAALLCSRRFSGSCEALCKALEDATTPESSGQDAVLRGSIEHVSTLAAQAAAALSLSSVRLKESEVATILADSLGMDGHGATGCMRELTDWGMAQVFENRDIAIHDAFRTVFLVSNRLSPQETKRVLTVLGRILRLSISRRSPDRFIAYCRIAPRIGEANVVVDMAGSVPEHLYEHGSSDALRQILTDTLDDPALSADDRFWAADTLTFWDIQGGEGGERIRADMVLLEERFALVSTDKRARQSIAIKRLLVAGKDKDLDRVRKAYAAAHSDAVGDPHGWLILRYTYAVGLLFCDELDAADVVTSTVANGYLNLIGLRPEQLLGVNPVEIREALGDRGGEIELIKHVADAIDLRARVLAARGGVVALLKMWAFKLFALAGAPLSAVRVGKDVVDELISIGALQEAKKFLERTLIPGIAEYRLPEEAIPLRAQYAVVLAYDGQIERARRELDELTVFESSSPLLAAELEHQRQLVEAINAGLVRLTPRASGGLDRRGLLMDVPGLNAGRNEPCPCGARLKFKRCCGR